MSLIFDALRELDRDGLADGAACRAVPVPRTVTSVGSKQARRLPVAAVPLAVIGVAAVLGFWLGQPGALAPVGPAHAEAAIASPDTTGGDRPSGDGNASPTTGSPVAVSLAAPPEVSAAPARLVDAPETAETGAIAQILAKPSRSPAMVLESVTQPQQPAATTAVEPEATTPDTAAEEVSQVAGSVDHPEVEERADAQTVTIDARRPSPEVHGLIGEVRAAMRAGQGAEVELGLSELARTLEPDDPTVLRLRGYWSLIDGRPEEALTHYGRVLRQRPDDLEAGTNVALAEHRLGRHEAARKRVKQLRVRYPDDPTVRRLHDLLGRAP